MTFIFNLVMLVALPLQSQNGLLGQSLTEDAYCNERFQFCSQFPPDVFPTQIDYRNGDGLLLKTENDLATVIIAGHRDFYGENTKDVFEHEVQKLSAPGERSVLISSLFGEDFYECFFLVGPRTFYQKAYFFDHIMVRLSIQTTINQPKLMQKLRGEVSLYFPEKQTMPEKAGLTGRE